MFLLNKGGTDEAQRLHCKSPDQKLTESALLTESLKWSKYWSNVKKNSNGIGTNQIGWRFSPYTLSVLINIRAFFYICSSNSNRPLQNFLRKLKRFFACKIVLKKHINPLFFRLHLTYRNIQRKLDALIVICNNQNMLSNACSSNPIELRT